MAQPQPEQPLASSSKMQDLSQWRPTLREPRNKGSPPQLDKTEELLKEVEAMRDSPQDPLSLSQKLVKSIVLLLAGLHRSFVESQTSNESPTSTRFPADASLSLPGVLPASDSTPKEDSGEPATPSTPSMTPAQYSELLEVLASALKDASSAPWLWNIDAAAALAPLGPMPTSASSPFAPLTPLPSMPTVHDVGVSSATLADYCDPFAVAIDQPSAATRSSAMTETPIDGIFVKDLPTLLFENLNDLIALLKPPSFSPTASPDLSALTIVTAPSSPRAMSPLPPAVRSVPVNKLPTELLARILKLARRLKDATSCECEHACASSRSASQRWALSLLLVCKDWKQASMQAAYSFVRLRRRSQVSGLVRLIRQKPEVGEIIAQVDIKVPAIVPAGSSGSAGLGGPAFLGHPRSGSRRGAAFPWLSAPDKKAEDSKEKGEEEDQLVSSLVELCPAVGRLDLNLQKPGFGFSWYGADFLEQGLERALSNAGALRSLILKTCIDYCELESILIACSSIEVLRLDGGVDNLDGADDAMEEPHHCRLKEFSINSWESADMGEQQLCWILRPSIGTLARLEVSTSVALSAAGLGGGAQFPPFSGFHFAELLVELAPTLVRLALKDSLGQGPGIGQINPTLRVAPHDGFFDYALARCVRLRELALEWAYAGPQFLTSLAGKPIEALALLGQPNGHTSAKDLANRITALEVDQSLGSLDRLALAHFPLHHAAQGWTARDVRYLRRACTEQKLSFEFTTI